MRPSRFFIQSVVGLAFMVCFVGFIFQGTPVGGLPQLFGITVAVASAGIFLFDIWLWRLPVICAIFKRPDLRGTWKGVLTTYVEDPNTGERYKPKVAFMVIEQTFWSITASQITDESDSTSTIALLYDKGNGQKQLNVIYKNEPKLEVRERSPIHSGSFKLDLSGTPTNRLEGHYWTDRNSMGEFYFDQRTKQTCGSIEEAEALEF